MNKSFQENLNNNILIVDQDQAFIKKLLEVLAGRSIHGTVATDTHSAIDLAGRNSWKVVLVDEKLCDLKQIHRCRLIAILKEKNPELPIILTSSKDTSELALQAMKCGFNDFLVKSADMDKLDTLLKQFCPDHQTTVMADANNNDKTLYTIIGQSPCLRQTVELAKKAAPTSAPILITGESGTGKELIAQLIHYESQRNNRPFIRINCAALNDSLLESELFGHEKGAFTGAVNQRKGCFERADGGTLMLDEITETSPAFQSRLLRILEQMDFERVGGSENININVRIISTTNTNILEKVKSCDFRADLYYRLCGIQLTAPPLRERMEDLTDLIWHFINAFSSETGRIITQLDPEMLSLFSTYNWPGNIRQLRNFVRTAIILGSGNVLSLPNASWLLDELQSNEYQKGFEDIISLAGMNLQQLEQQAILATLNKTDGNRTKAARVLGISDRTLRDKLKKYEEHERFQMIS